MHLRGIFGWAGLALGALSARASVSWDQLEALPKPPPDQTIAYGPAPAQEIDVRLPSGDGLRPVVLLIHGGCWLNSFDRGYMGYLADALCKRGWATFNVEYRRVGDPGGGWPGSFEDILKAYAWILGRKTEWRLDPTRIIIAGHSAGGQLALLLAEREPLIRGVVGLAAITDLRSYQAEPTGCGEGARAFAGPAAVEQADPMSLPLPKARIVLISGSRDTIVPARYAARYAARDSAMAAPVLMGAGHFDLVAPISPVWDQVIEIFQQFK